MKTPLLFITFNRPDTTAKVFEKIKNLKPKKLFISSDGPRNYVEGEFEKVMTCREMFKKENIDWDCEVKRLYYDENKGCALAVSDSITKSFELVDELIILEDDVIPHPSFFTFCSKMLNQYRDNHKVMHISGTRWNPEFEVGKGDHFFSLIGHIWGWATWKRAWKKYDYDLKDLPQFEKDKSLQKLYQSKSISKFWLKNFHSVNMPNKKTWDYQWQFSIFFNEGLAVVPAVNLTSNIGTQGVHYQGEATEHHFQETFSWEEQPDIFVNIKVNMEYEKYHMRKRFMKKPPLSKRIRDKVRRTIARP
ncbi:hypothetical protein D1013_04430 [Euzebyella marina]|uniref:Nucleotide-diphospho-sugar transferase n=1 Tax=Euzebyella marina TaxID=1761453 RepID=A0A3G2L351_9FLAO|nr:hypothetical protein [Euzebyella marina]AYN66682.1 hypothetical protein D1013_04430 [Euzebyella marina]